METKNSLNIAVNTKEQRILLVADDFQISSEYNIKHSDFDAVMFLSENGDLVAAQFLHLNPLIEKAFYLKPFFINQKVLNLPFLKEAADGLSVDYNESSVISKIDEVQQRLKKLNLEIKDEALKLNDRTILVGIFRFFLSRGGIPTPRLQKGALLGYTLPIYEFYMKHKLISLKPLLSIYKEYIDNSYIERIDIIDVVQYCRYCNHSHIIYTEICPKCGSCDIDLLNMLHHFVCANIAIETSYMNKGDLICPKCNKALHHIGVDYDRPASIYKCNNCSTSFTQANMRGTCVTCKKVSSLNNLRIATISSLKFTPIGATAITLWSIYASNKDAVVCTGFLSSNKFVEYVTNETLILSVSSSNNKLTTIRIKGVTLSRVEELSIFIFDNITNSKCTYIDDYIYISLTNIDDDTADDYALVLDTKIKTMDIEEYIGIDYVNYMLEMDVTDYLKKLF